MTSQTEIGPKRAAGGPLNGVLVIDLTRVLAGPYCTLLLSDLGARVIKVEIPESGDDARQIGPFIKKKSAYFMSLNRGKESIALNLKSDSDRQIFHQLLSRADVLVENFRSGTMDKLNLGWDILHERYPGLIYAATSGFGHSGPYQSKPAYDLVVQAMGGIMSLTGQEGGPPTRVGTSIGDLGAGLFTAVGICSALYHRSQTGEALKIDVGMLDCQVALLENAIARYLATGSVPGPLGARHPSIAPFDAYTTKDSHIIVAAGNNNLFERFAKAIGGDQLGQDHRYATNDLRCQNVEALKHDIEALLNHKTTAEWIDTLETAGVPCGPINTVSDVLSDEQVKHRNMVITTPDPTIGDIKMAGNPIKFDHFDDPRTRPAAPDLDADRQQILASLGINTTKKEES
jgi:CoA:oxalate CoA-transferase